MNLAKLWKKKANSVSQRKSKTKFLEKINADSQIDSMCWDSKQVECKMWMGSMQSMMPSTKSRGRIQAEPGQEFPKFRASYRYFFLFGIKWYISQTFFDSFD